MYKRINRDTERQWYLTVYFTPSSGLRHKHFERTLPFKQPIIMIPTSSKHTWHGMLSLKLLKTCSNFPSSYLISGKLYVWLCYISTQYCSTGKRLLDSGLPLDGHEQQCHFSTERAPGVNTLWKWVNQLGLHVIQISKCKPTPEYPPPPPPKSMLLHIHRTLHNTYGP